MDVWLPSPMLSQSLAEVSDLTDSLLGPGLEQC